MGQGASDRRQLSRGVAGGLNIDLTSDPWSGLGGGVRIVEAHRSGLRSIACSCSRCCWMGKGEGEKKFRNFPFGDGIVNVIQATARAGVTVARSSTEGQVHTRLRSP
jgi:hypothetical protein